MARDTFGRSLTFSPPNDPLIREGDTDGSVVYVERSIIHPHGWTNFVVWQLAIFVLLISTFALRRVKECRGCWHGPSNSSTETDKDEVPAESSSCDDERPAEDFSSEHRSSFVVSSIGRVLRLGPFCVVRQKKYAGMCAAVIRVEVR